MGLTLVASVRELPDPAVSITGFVVAGFLITVAVGRLADAEAAREAAKAIAKQRYLQFGCEGQGGKIKGDNLQVMAARYAKGELAQTVR